MEGRSDSSVHSPFYKRSYENLDHNFDTLLQHKPPRYENPNGRERHKSTGSAQELDHPKSKGSKSENLAPFHTGTISNAPRITSKKSQIYSGDYTLGTLSLKAADVMLDKGNNQWDNPSLTMRNTGNYYSNLGELHQSKSDHNFDRLNSSHSSIKPTLGNMGNTAMDLVHKYSHDSPPKRDYWKEYQIKYGKLGITDDSVGNNNHCSPLRISTSLENMDRTGLGSPSLSRNSGNYMSQSFHGGLSKYNSSGLGFSALTYSSGSHEGLNTSNFQRNAWNTGSLSVAASRNILDSRKSASVDNLDKNIFRNSSQEIVDRTPNESVLRKSTKSQSNRRRATSDLGFLTNKNATPRTSALLNNPTFRKHLSKVMGVKETETGDNLPLELALRLATSTSDLLKSQNKENNEPKICASELSKSVSDSSLKSKSAENSPRSSYSFDNECKAKNEHDFNTEPILMRSLPLSKTQPESDPGSKVTSRSRLSKFHIPSFNEFKKSRGKNSLLPDKPSILQGFVHSEETITEETDSDLENKGQGDRRSRLSLDTTSNTSEKPKQLRRAKTASSLPVHDLEGQAKVKGQMTVHENNGAERITHRKEDSRRKAIDSHDLESQGQSQKVSHDNSNADLQLNIPYNTVPNTEVNLIENQHKGKPHKPKTHKISQICPLDDSDNFSTKTEDQSPSSFVEFSSWKKAVSDSEKEGESDSGQNAKSEKTRKVKRKSSRREKDERSRTKSAERTRNNSNERTALDKPDIVIESKSIDTDNLADCQAEKSGTEPKGRPPMIPKKVRRKSDRRSPRQKHLSKLFD